MAPRVFKGRKLLIASIGVAAVTYACTKEQERRYPVGNLMAPAPYDAGSPMADAKDAGSSALTPSDLGMTSGNLVAPPPTPASTDAGAGKLDAGKKK